MHLLWMIIFGAVVGVVAKLLMPGRDPGGFWITVALGIAGSFVGTIVGQALHLYRSGQSAGFLMSTLGAVLVLALYRMANRRTT